MSTSGKVDALWVGIYGAQLPDGTILETGITVCSIGRDEAKDSDNWEPMTKAEAKAKITEESK